MAQFSGRVGILPAEPRILRRGLLPLAKARSGGTPEPAGETPTLPEIAWPPATRIAESALELKHGPTIEHLP
jgi:hypothetical protein